MTTMTYREAARAALREALVGDPCVFLMSEDVGREGGACARSRSLLEEFGEERVRKKKKPSSKGIIDKGFAANSLQSLFY